MGGLATRGSGEAGPGVGRVGELGIESVVYSLSGKKTYVGEDMRG